jgi:hypothetical protein
VTRSEFRDTGFTRRTCAARGSRLAHDVGPVEHVVRAVEPASGSSTRTTRGIDAIAHEFGCTTRVFRERACLRRPLVG